MASLTEVVSGFSWPQQSGPESIPPPATNTQGRSSRAAAISIPGTILSQLPSSTSPSSRWAQAMISMLSAMLSREGST